MLFFGEDVCEARLFRRFGFLAAVSMRMDCTGRGTFSGSACALGTPHSSLRSCCRRSSKMPLIRNPEKIAIIVNAVECQPNLVRQKNSGGNRHEPHCCLEDSPQHSARAAAAARAHACGNRDADYFIAEGKREVQGDCCYGKVQCQHRRQDSAS
jgi:hypothetical protein